MNDTGSPKADAAAEARIGKQIVLPWSKAIEIAAKSIKVRFWRSMITMSSIVLAIAFLMSIWTSTAIVASLAVGPQGAIEAAKEEIRRVRVAVLAEWAELVEAAIAGSEGALSADEVAERLSTELDGAVRTAEKAVGEKRLALRDAAPDVRKKLQAEIDALAATLEPDQRLPLLRDHLKSQRQELLRAVGAEPTADELESRFARDIRHAHRWTARQIREKTRAKKGASSADRKKRDAEIADLKEKARPEHLVQFLYDHLMRKRRRLERTKGSLDAILQQERVGSQEATAPEQQAAAPATTTEGQEPSQAAAGGFITDFLRQMSPTDTWLAILALLVCLVGITNAMFMTVQERFREIGTMKCLGALDGFIVKLFLLESAALGFIGTLLGIVVGLLLSSARQLVVYGVPLFTYFPLANILLAGLMSAIIGLLLSIAAAIFPAQRAARMEPVEAMRVEE